MDSCLNLCTIGASTTPIQRATSVCNFFFPSHSPRSLSFSSGNVVCMSPRSMKVVTGPHGLDWMRVASSRHKRWAHLVFRCQGQPCLGLKVGDAQNLAIHPSLGLFAVLWVKSLYAAPSPQFFFGHLTILRPGLPAQSLSQITS